jgi:hypothetical protein
MGKMRRDAKGRFTKALVKTKPQLPTDVKLARKMAKIQDMEKAVRATRYLVALHSFVVLACLATMVVTLLNTSYVCAMITTVAMGWGITETRSSYRLHAAAMAKHKRLLKGADSLTNKLLLEEGFVSNSDIYTIDASPANVRVWSWPSRRCRVAVLVQ